VPFALGLEDQVVLALLDGVLLAVLSVEVRRVLVQLVELDPVDVVVEQADVPLTLVHDLDAA